MRGGGGERGGGTGGRSVLDLDSVFPTWISSPKDRAPLLTRLPLT